ncbi:MAG: hypothetical protein GYA71_00415 [Bacteroidales bacterium]|jgi:hypothetical protein|nr:hypothetical protein [Bacteroidales bacterium]OQB59801.1 MAG: hypothetical protein BWX96_02557 [Bacteroidetes bacterium ADurb.Bin145]
MYNRENNSSLLKKFEALFDLRRFDFVSTCERIYFEPVCIITEENTSLNLYEGTRDLYFERSSYNELINKLIHFFNIFRGKKYYQTLNSSAHGPGVVK